MEDIQVLQKQITTLSTLVQRMDLAAKMGGQSYSGARDITQALGYIENPVYNDYFQRYLHQDLAKAIIDRPVKATWRGELALIEPDNDQETKLEKAFTELNKKLKLKSVFSRVDRLASLGRYGVLFLGLDDVKQPEDNLQEVKGGRQLKFIKPFGEDCTQIQSYETDTTNERYGLPLIYQLTVKTINTSQSFDVHYSRVIHIVEDPLESDIEGNPSLQAVFNRLMDLEKVVGGSAEMFWRGARPGYEAAVKPDFQMTQDIKDGLKDQFDEHDHNLRRFLTTEGVDIKALDAQVSDPKSQVDVIIQMISAQTGIPKRILTGSERGELASSQDADEWAAYVLARREEYAEPNIVRPFVDRCMLLGILPETEEYTVDWSDLFAISDMQQVEIGVKRATALNQYAASPVAQQIVSPKGFLEYFGGFSQDDIDLIEEMNSAEVALEPALTPEEKLLLKQKIEPGNGNVNPVKNK